MTIRTRFTLLATALVALLLGGSTAPAFAEGMPTTTKFLSPASQEVAFGSPWFVKIQVRQNDYYSPLDSADGTIDVFAEGIAEPLGDDLPLTRDGVAYFAQPADRPLLAAGTYIFSATFTPAAGTDNVTSRTTTPSTLVVTPLAVSTSFALVDDPARYAQPTVEARVGGEYVDVTGQAPAGSWTVVVTDDAGSEIFTDTAPQAADATMPTAIGLTKGIKPGKSYGVSAVFTPDEAIAGGLAVGEPEDQKLTTDAAGAFDGAVTPVNLPGWLIIALLALVILLAATVIALLVIGSRRTAVATAGDAAAHEPAAIVPAAIVPAEREAIGHEPARFEPDSFDAQAHVPTAHEPTAFGAEPTIDDLLAGSMPPAEERRSWSLGDDRD